MIEKPKFTVTFEILGQKFRTIVPAEDKAEAKGKVRNAIKFLSVEEGVYSKQEKSSTVNKDTDEIFNSFKDIFGDVFK